MLLSLNWQKEREAKSIGSSICCLLIALKWLVPLKPFSWVTSQCHLLGAGAHQAVPTPASAARRAVSSLPLCLPSAAQVYFNCFVPVQEGACPRSVLFGAGALPGSQRWSSTGTELLLEHRVSSDQWDHSTGLSQAPGARDDPGSYFPVGSEVLGCPTAFTWARVGGSSAQVLLCPQICRAQRLHKPANIRKVSPFFAQLWGQPGSFGPPSWAVDTTSPCCAAAHTWPPPAPRACVPSFCTLRERIPSFCCSCK